MTLINILNPFYVKLYNPFITIKKIIIRYSLVLEVDIGAVVRQHDGYPKQGKDRRRVAHGRQREISKQPQGQQCRNAPEQKEPMVRPPYAAIQPHAVLVLFDNARGAHLAVIGPRWDILSARLACQPSVAFVRVLAVRYEDCRLRIPPIA